jgi:hypothetical protein
MSTPANVHSVEAIELLRAALASFIGQIEDALTELDSEMRRMLEWLEHDRPKHWKLQLRLAADDVHAAKQALHRCLMFPIADEKPSCSEERAALQWAQARQAYCEEKVERVRHWQRTMEHELFDYRGRISQLVRLVDVEVPQATGVLRKIVRRLEEYQSVRAAEPQAAYNDLALVQEIWPADIDSQNDADEGASSDSSNDREEPKTERAVPNNAVNGDDA